MKALIFSGTDLGQLEEQLDAWRQGQSGRVRLPAELWEAAARVSRTHGVSRVSRVLGINFYRLQRQVHRGPVAAPVEVRANRFIELKVDPPSSAGPGVGWVELSEGPDRRMRLQTGSDPTTWLALAQGFWSSGR